ncbi:MULTISPECIES: biotin--[acetyl-CoA-carboxylase] ligase [unclassified Meiothermus]|uniref:biotin--[acetyl-CoA-carboxylase] ligase n=1 Tax=unclassified Meiothermus TaxID=370471 RepID=UPI000D7C8B65|nr:MULTISPECIES: biotin--[acetyl-CoA-carboxylase] ligase [unclassified Meiothermus]PZA08564.1 biotin--[acetyl-CoA-carboxylase] ligase [Meiothermus sp. Pnk-1]RYM40819.1 biotin--[acetyl-CoA-carboxylase] ligase [Meiothermus sp. PNK-Is4]
MSGELSPEALLPLLETPLGQRYCYLERTTSTQDVAKAWAEAGAPEGALVVAEVQEKGRGRRGRPWQSTPGESLTFSLLLRPRISPERFPLLSFAAGVALREACGVGGLKWPNDLLASDGRKLAGILLEAGRGYVVLGIGLNVRAAPPGRAALVEFAPAGRIEVLAGFLNRLGRLYPGLEGQPNQILSAWRRYSLTLGQEVVLETPQETLRGRAVDIAEDGSLWLEVSGTMRRVTSGDVDLVGNIQEVWT